MDDLHLPEGITLTISEHTTFVSRTLPSVREIVVRKYSEELAIAQIDERFFNTFKYFYPKSKETGLYEVPQIASQNWHHLKKIEEKFNEFKRSDPSYGNYRTETNWVIQETNPTYEGTIPLYTEDFFGYLKSENRNNIITNLLEK